MSTKTLPTITVIGAGYVGLTTATLLAEAGYTTFVLDVNEKRLSAIKEGRSFFFEAGIDPLIAHAIKQKKLLPTNSYEDSIPQSSIVFSCVGTPDNPDGSSNLNYVHSAAQKSIELMKPGGIFIQKSTVPVGTGEAIEKKYNLSKRKISYISNPEFLREGTAISDTLFFDRIVAGGNNTQAVERVMDLYSSIEKQRNKIAKRAGIEILATKGSYITTNRDSAELIKVTANAFLALKISFANSIAKLADHTGADINEVMDAVGADRRIGRAFLNAGRGYGGGCFPKDVSGIIASASQHGVELAIMTAASDVNETMPGYIAEKAKEQLGNSLKNKRVAVLGLAFKAGTSDARRSPGVKLANVLARDGAIVCAYDPQANGEAQEELRRNITICETYQDAIKKADAVFIATEWPELISLPLATLKKAMSGTVLVDCMNMIDKSKVKKAGLHYIGVGR